MNPQKVKIVNLMAPAADAAGRTSAYVSLKDAIRAWIYVHINQGNAATILLTPNQASAVAGTGKKVIPAVPIWSNLDTAAGDTMVERTAAANYTTDAGVKIKTVVFQIDPSKLDLAGGFDCISIDTGASNAANITAATLVIEGRYMGPSIPTAVTD